MFNEISVYLKLFLKKNDTKLKASILHTVQALCQSSAPVTSSKGNNRAIHHDYKCLQANVLPLLYSTYAPCLSNIPIPIYTQYTQYTPLSHFSQNHQNKYAIYLCMFNDNSLQRLLMENKTPNSILSYAILLLV